MEAIDTKVTYLRSGGALGHGADYESGERRYGKRFRGASSAKFCHLAQR